MSRSPFLPLCCLLLTACGGIPSVLETLPSLAPTGPYDTALSVLEHLGQPCRKRSLPSGTEAWDYCGRECPPPGISRACMEPCAEGCPRGWTFYMAAGVVVRYELWGGE
jgi:hypothetical protein